MSLQVIRFELFEIALIKYTNTENQVYRID